MKLTTLTYT